MRDDAKRKILIRGLLPKIRTELWPRITEGASFEDICTAALAAESIVQKELNEEKTIVLASVDNAQLKEKETELTHKQTLIEMLKEQNDMLKLIHGKTDSQDQPTQASTVGAVVNQTQQSGFIKSGNKNAQFKDTPHKQGTGNSNTNSCNPNAERHPKASQKQNQQTGQQIPVHPFGPYLNPYPAYWVPQQTNHSQHGYGYPFAPNQAAHPAPIYPTQIPQQFQGLQQLPGPPQPFHGPRPLALPPTHWGPPPPPTPNWGQPHANWNSQPPGFLPHLQQKGALRSRMLGQPSEPTTETVGNVSNLQDDVNSTFIQPEIPQILPPLLRIPVSFYSVKCQALVDTGAAASFICLSLLRKLPYNKLVEVNNNCLNPMFRTAVGDVIKVRGTYQ